MHDLTATKLSQSAAFLAESVGEHHLEGRARVPLPTVVWCFGGLGRYFVDMPVGREGADADGHAFRV